MKRLISVPLAKACFLALPGNRLVKVNRLVQNIKDNKGIDIPPIVYRASDFGDSISIFRKISTTELVNPLLIDEWTYIVADGQHRIAAVNKINDEAFGKYNKNIDNKAIDFNITHLDLLLYDKDELKGRSLIEFIVNINEFNFPY